MRVSHPARSYRATLIPSTIQFDEVELQASQRLLPEIRVKADSAEQAKANAYRVSGKAVLDVERAD